MSFQMITIKTSQQKIAMGKTIRVEAQCHGDGWRQPFILLPFVNEKRWGAHERPDAEGKAVFAIPLPNPGPARVQVVALPADPSNWMGLTDVATGEPSELLLAGRPLPENGIFSNAIDLQVTRRTIQKKDNHGSFFGMQWEPWFCWGIRSWRTAQSVPLVGFYESFNADVTRQHILWCMDLGVDFIFPDWSNHIWGCQHWDERHDSTNAIIHCTTLFLEVLAAMKAEGLPVPQVGLFPGLSNGQPATMGALNEGLAWMYHNYLRNPRFSGLFFEFEGKPLAAPLDTGGVGDKRARSATAFRVPFFKQTLALSETELDEFRASQPPVDNTHFTIRWMSSQNQVTRHHELGFWSWMDGEIDPPVTYKDGEAEAVTVSVGFFAGQGWTGPGGYGRRGGATYLQTFQTALKHRPKVIFLHQFNEFTGQSKGHGYGPNKDIFVDTYNVEYSDDLEPVSLTAPGYRDDTGGWGFYYHNLTQAMLAIYRGDDTSSTILAVSQPLKEQTVTGSWLPVQWSFIGKKPSAFSILLDGNKILENLQSLQAEIPLTGLAEGRHTLKLVAENAFSHYRLAWDEEDERLNDALPVVVEVPFTYSGK